MAGFFWACAYRTAPPIAIVTSTKSRTLVREVMVMYLLLILTHQRSVAGTS